MSTDSTAAVARTILIHGPISRAALAVRMGLSPASLTRLTKPFVDRGVLVELGDVVDGVGRPSRPLDVSDRVGTFVGVKLTGGAAHVVLTDVHAQLLGEVVVALPSHDPRDVVDAIVTAMASLVGEGAAPAGIGVSFGGKPEGGTVLWAPYLEWDNVPLADLVTAATGLPTRIENDLIALTEAERWFGVVRGLDGFAVITIGVGMGYAVVSGGEVVRNADSGISLAAHVPLDAFGPLCPEGHHGCAQAMLGSDSIAAQASLALQRPVTYDEVLDLASAGDPTTSAIVDASARALGRLIALAANFTQHADIVLAGEGMGLFRIGEKTVRETVAMSRDPSASEVHMHVDESGFTAWARGAAAVAIQAAFERL